MKNILIFLLAPLALLLANCAPQTPESRIAKHPEIYNSLSDSQKEQVAQGHISNGMPSGGVFLAWGAPATKSEGQKGNTPFVRWDYTNLKPVYTWNYWGYGYYPRGYYGVGSYGGPTPEVTYIPYKSASVFLTNDKVARWEKMQQPAE